MKFVSDEDYITFKLCRIPFIIFMKAVQTAVAQE